MRCENKAHADIVDTHTHHEDVQQKARCVVDVAERSISVQSAEPQDEKHTEEQENRQINRVNTDHFRCNYSYIKSSIETKLNTSSFLQ